MRKITFKRKFVATMALLALLSSANAESLIIEETSGTTTAYDLGSAPVITYSGNNLVLKSSIANAEFELEKVAKYYFKPGDPTGNTNVTKPLAYVAVTEESLIMKDCQPGEPVALFSIDGKLLGNYTIAPNGSLEISLSELPQGIFIVKTNSANINLIRK